jgi:glycerol-3-phosphate acyltransferase PlsY
MFNSSAINPSQAMIIKILAWTLSAYLLGSIPFSILITKLFSGSDIRKYGDGNPGAYNAWQVGGWKVGVAAIVLDVGKGAFPVLLAQQLGGLVDWAIVPVAIAPILGHAFSPFLQLHGGKAVATTLGVWFGLTGIAGIVAFAIFAIGTMIWQDEHAWYVIFGMLGVTVYCIFISVSTWLVTAALVNMLLLGWKQRHELLRPIPIHNRTREFLLRRKNS